MRVRSTFDSKPGEVGARTALNAARSGLGLMLPALLLTAACGGNTPKPTATPTQPAPATAAATVRLTATPAPIVPTIAQRTPTPAASPTETPDDSPMSKLVIPSIKVNANFVTLGIIAATNTMDSPKTKDDVGYYNFTPRPTFGGNTVLSGHVDWFTGEVGVFYDLKKLSTGDEIDVVLKDGKTFRYKVSSNDLYDADSAPVDEIIGDTPKEAVTLITCEGVFNRSSAEYNKRRVVRAERMYT